MTAMTPTTDPPTIQAASSAANGANARKSRKSKPRARTGSVARLPQSVRDSICRMMQDGLSYRAILQNLGPDATGLNKHHLSEWRTGGYLDWQAAPNRRRSGRCSWLRALPSSEQATGNMTPTWQQSSRTLSPPWDGASVRRSNQSAARHATSTSPFSCFRRFLSFGFLSDFVPRCGRISDFRRNRAVILALFAATSVQAGSLDLKNAVVVSPPGLSGPEQKAVQMLIEEVEKRTHVRWSQTAEWSSSAAPVILVGNRPALEGAARPYAKDLEALRSVSGAEGYELSVKHLPYSPVVFVIGNDARGVLFGVGRLLRELHMQRGSVSVDDGLGVASAPKYPLRGHQLGYRPKCNSYDAWDLPVWEQYFRDLAVFGCNAIELIPPRSDDDSDSPHFPRPPMEMMIGMSRVADSYGLDVWIWYPAMDKDYSDPKTVEFALREWGDVFAKLPRIDAVFVPGGDPGHTQPKFLMALLEKQTQNLHRHHPKAQMWVSPQSFNQAWLDEFLGILKDQQPAWLSGVVFGPQVRISLPRLRELVPKQYPIRHYPDITHSRQCQYPVPNWDVAYAVTEARECINPRPEGEAIIFRKTQPYTIGFLTYSEGCNDDVNKTVWSTLGWDPEAKVPDILRQYSRYFIGERYTDSFAEGLLALERNWQGPLAPNTGVDTTLAQFQALEKGASPTDLKNWRFQQALLRAYYDAYVRQRLIAETDAEASALHALASGTDWIKAMAEAEDLLDRPATQWSIGAMVNPNDGKETNPSVTALHRSTTPLSNPFIPQFRMRIFQLAEALFQSIGMQLDVGRYKAIAADRGAMLETLDFPLNNRGWLKHRFTRIRKLSSDADRRKAIEEILNWTNPGPGGFYDDLGNPARQPHLVQGGGFSEDPGAMLWPRVDFEEDLVFDEPEETAGVPRRMSWVDHAESLYEAPLQMRYTGLDPSARYKLRVVYGGDNFKRKIRLVANDGIEIHPLIAKPYPVKPIEFAIPPSATKNGELTLSWSGEPGLGGNGRNCQVSEVWLIKETREAGAR